jgi:primosomal protein N' (replication factor Y)
MFIQVAIDIPSERTFTYAVPPFLAAEVALGKRVRVPFGRRRQVGVILAVEDVAPDAGGKEIREILDVVDPEPLFGPEELRFYRWAASYYLYPLGKALADVLPGTEYRSGGQRIRLTEDAADRIASPLSPSADILCAVLAERRNGLTLNRLRKVTGIEDIRKEIRELQDAGLVRVTEAERRLAPRRGGEAPGETVRTTEAVPILNPDQRNAVETIRESLNRGGFAPFLLHGVTGSGKTEVYLRAIADVLERGGGALLLVPEIALTGQLLDRLQARFPRQAVAVLHSGVSRTVRYDQWRQIRQGRLRLIIGARSALFAPVRDLKLVVVDEEHDLSYKQDDRMHYQARDLAVIRAKLAGAAVILGSATPELQSYFNIAARKYRLLTLPDRVLSKPLPQVEVIDMRGRREAAGQPAVLSAPLQAALRETLSLGRQSILFLNRRGSHAFMVCLDCGQAFRCLNCAVSLTYYGGDALLKCHYCGFRHPVPPACPACGSSRLGGFGVGTEKVEEEVRATFPEARIARLDSDTTTRRGAHIEILQRLARQEIDILIGTQMVAKGHDFPGVTLVGVISADTSMNLPDFRAAERTFQILTQVAGRGGRGETPGRVLIQTFNPGHYALLKARHHDYTGFYREEIASREALSYPPFSRLVSLHLSCRSREKGRGASETLGRLARELAASGRSAQGVEVIGPAEAPVAKIKGRYRWQLLLKGKHVTSLHALARSLFEHAAHTGLDVRIDVDPVHFL